ncbi:hypothetical protein ACEWY4_011601 [Coilia grayii]|uniref:SOCS box domain-containing protein n=1 Tax=Coilia grayii TaxID=363190 RepID=A0ABD1JYJ3_9TELE
MWKDLLPVLQWREETVNQTAMPFLHGFRRIVYEYQPLVDAVLCAVGLQEEAKSDGLAEEEEEEEKEKVCGPLKEVLEREAQSAVFVEGISCALFRMAQRGLLGPARVLLHYGAHLNFEDPVSYYTPLHIAVLRNRPLMVRLLVQHGADINKRDRIHESSPLDLASEEADRLPCLRMLLELGAHVNARDRTGKTALLHALASSDGLTVDNSENIRLLLAAGASVQAYTSGDAVGDTVMSLVVSLVLEALESSEEEEAAAIGRFCLRVTELLLDHGAEPSCSWPSGQPGCAGEQWGTSLTEVCLGHFDLLFPLAVLLLRRGVALHCLCHSAPCWYGRRVLLRRLERRLRQQPNMADALKSDLLDKAEALLELADTCCVPHCRQELPLPHTPPPALHTDSPPHTPPPAPRPDSPPHTPPPAPLPLQAVLDLRVRLREQETRPRPLRLLCRRFLRRHLGAPPLEPKVQRLPLPDRLKDFLLPELAVLRRPGWDRCLPNHSPR